MEEEFFEIPEEMDIPPFSKISQSMHEVTIRKYYPEFYTWINEKYPDINNWAEKLCLFYNKMKTPPPCANKNCEFGGVAKFNSLYKGWYNHCCSSCSNKDKETIGKIQQTKFNNHGDKGYNNYEQTFLTKEKRYGDPHYNNLEKFKQTNIKKFGKEFPSQVVEIKNKSSEKRRETTNKKNGIIDRTENDEWICQCDHDNCPLQNKCDRRFTIKGPIYRWRKNLDQELCTILNPIGSNKQSEFEKNVRKILDKFSISYTCNRTDIIRNDTNNKLEIDIMVDSYHISIECNGCFWHSIENSKTGKNQHVIKFKKCLEKNLELISIWEDWNMDDVSDFLRDKFEGRDLSKYKSLWFPDLDDSQWPLDLGWYKGIPPDPNKIIPHHCFHRKFKCSDSGLIIISK